MKVLFMLWPHDPRYLQIVAKDMPFRSAGQIGSLDLRATLLEPEYYKAFWDLYPPTQDKVREQVQKVIDDEFALRAVAERLTS